MKNLDYSSMKDDETLGEFKERMRQQTGLPEKYLLQYIIKRTKKDYPTWQDVNELNNAAEKMMTIAFESGEESFGEFNKTLERIKFDRKRIGVMVSYVHPDQPDLIAIGYSLCNLSARDKFDYQLANVPLVYVEAEGFGFHIACGRAESWAVTDILTAEVNKRVPASIQKQFIDFINRSQRYYKDKYIPAWVTQFLSYYA